MSAGVKKGNNKTFENEEFKEAKKNLFIKKYLCSNFRKETTCVTFAVPTMCV